MENEQPVITNASVHAQELWMRMVLAGFSGVTAIIAMPIELAMRPRFGTMYFHPVTAALGCLLMQLITAFGLAAQPAARAAAGGHSAPIGMGVVYLLFCVACLVHTPRLWRRAMHMELEEDAEDEGPALPFFRLLPMAGWGMTRIVYEPLSIVLAGIVGYALGLIEPFVLAYLLLVSAALAWKNAIRWYEVWRVIREILNNQSRGRTLQTFVKGKASPATVGPFVLAAAAAASPALRRTIATSIAPGLTPDDAALLTPRDTGEGFSGAGFART